MSNLTGNQDRIVYLTGRIAQTSGDYFTDIARYDEAKEEYLGAISAYDQAIRLGSDPTEIYYDKGTTLQSLGHVQAKQLQEQEARKSWSTALDGFSRHLEFAPDNDEEVSNRIKELEALTAVSHTDTVVRKPAVVAIFEYQSQVDSVLQQLDSQFDLSDKEITVTGGNFSNEKQATPLDIRIILRPSPEILAGSTVGFWLGLFLALLSINPLKTDPLGTLLLGAVGGIIVGTTISAVIVFLFSASPVVKIETTLAGLKIPDNERNMYEDRAKAEDFLLIAKPSADRITQLERLLKNAGGKAVKTFDAKSIFEKLESRLNKLLAIR